MSRRRAAEKRTILPDHKFKDLVLAKFMKRIMLDGKKSLAYKIFYDSLDIVSKKLDKDIEKTPLEVWKDALSNVMPHVEVRSRRVGGATFQIPMQIRPDRKVSLAMKWLISVSRKRNDSLLIILYY